MEKFNGARLTSLTLLILLATLSTTIADNSVHISSKFQQRVTSSTLNWLPISHYDSSKQFVTGGFQRLRENLNKNHNETNHVEQYSKQKPIFVCRVQHNGAYVAGSQPEGEKNCTVTFLGKVKTYDRYELLENVGGAAKLAWVFWDKFHQIPLGAIATDTMYVARHNVSKDEENDNNNSNGVSYTHYIGTLDPNEKLGAITYVNDNGTETSSTSGEILVETEPTKYELIDVQLNKWRKRVLKSEPKILSEATIKNTGNEVSTFAEAFGYKYKYFSYWGHRPEMIKALGTTISLVNRTLVANISWGMDERSDRDDAYTVQVKLEPGTAVNVTLLANYTDFEVPYTGQLISHYKDGQTLEREFNGIRREETMIDVHPQFSPIYFLSNFSIVPTTMAPPTTLKTTVTLGLSSTTSPTMTKIPTHLANLSTASGSTTSFNTNKDVINREDNMVISRQKYDNTSMLNSDGPLSLKNKEDSTQNDSNSLTFSLPFLLSSIFLSLSRFS